MCQVLAPTTHPLAPLRDAPAPLVEVGGEFSHFSKVGRLPRPLPMGGPPKLSVSKAIPMCAKSALLLSLPPLLLLLPLFRRCCSWRRRRRSF